MEKVWVVSSGSNDDGDALCPIVAFTDECDATAYIESRLKDNPHATLSYDELPLMAHAPATVTVYFVSIDLSGDPPYTRIEAREEWEMEGFPEQGRGYRTGSSFIGESLTSEKEAMELALQQLRRYQAGGADHAPHP
ncbi:MAG: hypothetical protein KGL39_20685 [Patescibacteria group bacterium]|nr:hypothetical protein [Patescibacteria group bacterium]